VLLSFIRLVGALFGFFFGFYLGAGLLQVTEVRSLDNQLTDSLLSFAAWSGSTIRSTR
jgi:hypothetical protein